MGYLLNQMEDNERLIEEQIELQEQERAKQDKELKEEIKFEENQKLSVKKKNNKVHLLLLK